MTDQEVIALAEAIKADLDALKLSLRKKYALATRQVTNKDIKAEAKRIAEQWITKLASSPIVEAAVEEEPFAELSVQFQRLHSSAYKSAKRSTYDAIIRVINRFYSDAVLLAIKAAAGRPRQPGDLLAIAEAPLVVADKVPTAFVGHSFDTKDKAIAGPIVNALEAIGVIAVTGEKPKADRISDKIKELIESQEIFVGVFTRRDKIQGRNEWTTPAWILEEKAYAVAKKKKLVMLREDGVGTIGGIHGDHEYIPFKRTKIESMLVQLLRMFSIRTSGLR